MDPDEANIGSFSNALLHGNGWRNPKGSLVGAGRQNTIASMSGTPSNTMVLSEADAPRLTQRERLGFTQSDPPPRAGCIMIEFPANKGFVVCRGGSPWTRIRN
jgi:hypothetical protein